MAQTGLEDRIEHWPQQWKVARERYVEAKALVAKLEMQFERAKERASQTGEGNDAVEAEEDVAETALYEADQRILDLDFHVQEAAFEVERVKAAADVRVRQEAAGTGKRTTEDAVAAQVKTDPAYAAVQHKLLEAKRAHALAKLERDQQYRLQRQLLRTKIGEDMPRDEPESDAILAIRAQLEAAYDQLESARTELAYQGKVGRTLEMLCEVLKADSAVAAVVQSRR